MPRPLRPEASCTSMEVIPFGECSFVSPSHPTMAVPNKTFVGFGFVAIQAGLFLWEAQQSGNFDRLVVAMTNDEIVSSLRRASGRFRINVAAQSARRVYRVKRVENYNRRRRRDRSAPVS